MNTSARIGLAVLRRLASFDVELHCTDQGRTIRDEYVIVDGGSLAGTGAHSYSVTK
ncbi:hypothetical protein ACIRU3_21335 [Streptomyces sp. NPDC101151]|uniref:hypothetical protein n=1 Tax=Streptomyces sp. NPDC101151 TaxID=3366115 RepID=UPI0037F2898A